jgi:molecular chaperone DnaJ
MAEKRDYYELLGVARDAGAAEIKAAYRKVAMRHHPDRNPGDTHAEERFKQAAEAYAVLSDPEKRQRYDRFGHQGVGAGGFDPTIFADFSDILGDLFGFGDLFGGRRRRGSASTPGADLRYDLVLSFADAAFGVESQLEIPRLETCADCAGSGSASRAAPAACSACQGHGQVRYTQGFLTVARTCPQCGGEGRVVRDPCRACGGDGRREQRRTLQVKVPAGVDTGARLRLPGEGEHGRRGGRSGDLYVVLHVEPDPRFERHGADVLGAVELSYPQAVLGATVDVETLHGAQPLEVPPGTEPGDQFRLRGKGIARLDGRGRGDHVVRVALRVPDPKQLGEEEIRLLRRLAELEGEPVRPERKVMKKVKDLFG